MGCIFVLYLFTGCNLFLSLKWVVKCFLSVCGLWVDIWCTLSVSWCILVQYWYLQPLRGYVIPVPSLSVETRKSRLPFQKNFLFFYFFYFCITIIHQPVRVVSSFAGFFRVECLKIEYFLDVWVVIGCRNAKFGYF